MEHIKAFHKANGEVDKMDFEKLDDDKNMKTDQNYAVNDKFNDKYKKLTQKIKSIVEDYNMVSLLPMDINDPETVHDIIYHADSVIQYGELKEPEESAYFEAEDKLNRDANAYFGGNMGDM